MSEPCQHDWLQVESFSNDQMVGLQRRGQTVSPHKWCQKCGVLSQRDGSVTSSNLEAECARYKAALTEIAGCDFVELRTHGFSVGDFAISRARSALEPTAEKAQPSGSLKVSDTTND